MTVLVTKTAAQNKITLSYHRVRGVYFLAVVFAATMIIMMTADNNNKNTLWG